MTKLLRFEWKKLRAEKLFLCLFGLLLLANLLTLYLYERHGSVYFYVWEQRESYRMYLRGDSEADIDGYYQREADTQDSYIASYPAFVEDMEERVQQMGRVSLYTDQENYIYRNLQKTCADFEKFSGIPLKKDNCFGVRKLADSNSGILFLLIFLGITVYYVVFYERDKNLLLLLKGSRMGHMPLAAAKWLILLGMAVLYTLLQETGTVLLIGFFYGYGDMGRTLQSVDLFRNCAYELTVGEAILAVLWIRIGIAVVAASLLFFISMLVRNEVAAVGSSAAVLGAEYLFSRVFSISGGLGGLKCVNLFYCWNMRKVLGEYYNLNLMGYPAGKDICAVTAAVLAAGIFAAAGIWMFHRTCQIRTESRVEQFIRWLRQKHVLGRRSQSLLYYEFHKMLVQEKKGIVLALLLMWGIYEAVGVFQVKFYANASEAAYHYYLQQLHGPVTEQTFDFIDQEAAYLDSKRQKLRSLADSQAAAASLQQIQIQAELEKLEGGFEMVREQMEYLKEKEGDIRDKYFVDELAYRSLWEDTNTDIGLWLAGSAAVIYFVSGIYAVDQKKNMLFLLRSTSRGRRELRRSKDICALLCTAALFLITELPLFLRYYEIDHFVTVMQRLCDFTNAAFISRIRLVWLLCAVWLCKLVSFLAVGVAGLKLSKLLKNEILAALAGIALAASAAILCYRFRWDWNQFWIRRLF